MKRNPKLLTDLMETFRSDPQNVEFGKIATEKIYAQYRLPEDNKKRKVDGSGLSSIQTMLSRLKRKCMELNIKDMDYAEDMERIKRAFPDEMKEIEEFDKMPLLDADKLRHLYRRNPTSKLRRMLGQLFLVPRGLINLRLTREDSMLLKSGSIKRRDAKMKEAPIVIDAPVLLARVCPWLNSDKIEELIPALLLVTGRRCLEVIHSGSLSDSKRDSPKCVPYATFDGQLKTGLAKGQPYEIPLLANLAIVQFAWNKLRELMSTKGLTHEQIHAKYSVMIQRVMKKKLGDLCGGKITAHVLRAAYSNICYQWLNNSRMSYIAYLSTVLGHESMSMGTFYQRVEIQHLDCQKLPFV